MSQSFYVLDPGWGTQFYFAEVLSRDIPREAWANGMRRFDGTLRVRIIKGGRPGDFLRVSSLYYIVSINVVEAVREHALTGFSICSVEVEGGRGDLPRYYGMAVCGKGGHVLDKESGVVFAPDAEPGKRDVIGMDRLVFTVDQWDGSDFFYLEERPMSCLVTERVKEAFKKHKITNYELIPTEEFRWGINQPI